ncbi:MAG: DUF1501 domain-containing protein [Pirellulales bacterium]
MKLLQAMNKQYASGHPEDTRLEARVASYELAARMQLAAPEAFDLSKETEQTHKAYGTDRAAQEGGFARNRLLARRLLRDVRFVRFGVPQRPLRKTGTITAAFRPSFPRSPSKWISRLLHFLRTFKARGSLRIRLSGFLLKEPNLRNAVHAERRTRS